MGFLDRISHSMDPVRRKSLILSYAVDWATTILLFLAFALIDKAPGFQRQFSVNDSSIQHTFATQERVPFYYAILAAAVVPALLMLLVGGVVRRSFYDVHNSLLGLVLSLALTTTLTDLIKITVGRPRPDFLDRCQLIMGTIDATPYGLTSVASCTQTNRAILVDGFKSFLSGHSSFSFCGLGYLSFYLAGKLHLFSDHKGYAYKAWLSFAPLVVAALIAISRTMDYRHHATDVLAGAVVGLLIAFLIYRMYYPCLTDLNSHLPYSPRIPASSTTLPHHSISTTTHSSGNGLAQESELTTPRALRQARYTGLNDPSAVDHDDQFERVASSAV